MYVLHYSCKIIIQIHIISRSILFFAKYTYLLPGVIVEVGVHLNLA